MIINYYPLLSYSLYSLYSLDFLKSIGAPRWIHKQTKWCPNGSEIVGFQTCRSCDIVGAWGFWWLTCFSTSQVRNCIFLNCALHWLWKNDVVHPQWTKRMEKQMTQWLLWPIKGGRRRRPPPPLIQLCFYTFRSFWVHNVVFSQPV